MFNIEVNGSSRKVEFRVEEIPNDMKHLHFLAGEHDNNATYFTTFANVSNAIGSLGLNCQPMFSWCDLFHLLKCCNQLGKQIKAWFNDHKGNTMEGHEQRHQKISQYQQKATWYERWDKAFRHEYVSLVYLCRNGFDQLKYTKTSTI